MPNATFNDPVFVRMDNGTRVKASVIEWNEESRENGGISILISNGSESVMIQAEDWKALVGCVNVELDRVS